MQDLDQAIRERAYHLWEAGGRSHGSADSHWLKAQQELLATAVGTFATTEATTAPKKARAKKAAAPKKTRQAA